MLRSPRYGLPPPPVPRIQAPTASASTSSSASSLIELRYQKDLVWAKERNYVAVFLMWRARDSEAQWPGSLEPPDGAGSIPGPPFANGRPRPLLAVSAAK